MTWSASASDSLPEFDLRVPVGTKAQVSVPEAPVVPADPAPTKPTIAVTVAPKQKEKPKIAVVGFKPGGSSAAALSSGWGRYVTDKVEAAVASIGRWTILDRSSLEHVTSEQQFQNSGATQDGVELGMMAGATNVMTGTYDASVSNKSVCDKSGCNTIYSAQVALTYKLIDVKTGAVVGASDQISGAATSDASSNAAYSKAMDLAIKDLRASLRELFPADEQGVSLVIIRKEGKTVWIRGGKNVGLNVGDVFEAASKGKEIRDPETGEVLTVSKQTKGRIMLTEVREKVSVAHIVEGETSVDSGQALRELPRETGRMSYWYVSLAPGYTQKKVTGNTYYRAKNFWGLAGLAFSGGWREKGTGFGVGADLGISNWGNFNWMNFDLEGRFTWYVVPERFSIGPLLQIGADMVVVGKESDFKSALYYSGNGGRSAMLKDATEGGVWTTTTPSFDAPTSIAAGGGLGAAVTVDLGRYVSIGYKGMFGYNMLTSFTSKESSSSSSSSSDGSSSESNKSEISIDPDFVRFVMGAGVYLRHQLVIEGRF
jgi:hypothetical protein